MRDNHLIYTGVEAPGLSNKGMFVTNAPQKEGYGYFYCTVILGDKKDERGVIIRREENVKFVTCVFADFDNPKEYENVDSFVETTLRDVEMTVPLTPTRIVRTAKGVHYTWDFVTPLTPTDELTALRDHVPVFLGSDPAVSGAVQLLRMPGSIHWKTGKPIPVTTISECEDNKYTLDEIKKAFGFVYQKEVEKKVKKDFKVDSLWSKYNNDARFTFESILTEAGWSLWDNKKNYYTRPGKKEGTSGHIIETKTGGTIFYVFTKGAPPLEEHGCYSKSWLLLHLKFNKNKAETLKYFESLYPTIVEKQNIAISNNNEQSIPDFCLHGVIGELTQAFGGQEFSNLLTSVFMSGVCSGKLYYEFMGSYIKPTLYVLLVGSPSSGKSTKISIVEDVFSDPRYGVHPGTSPESGQVFVRIACGLKETEEQKDLKGKTVKKLTPTPKHQTLFAIDEFYTCIKSSKSNSSTLMEKMRSGYMASSLSTSSIANQRDGGAGYVMSATNPFIYMFAGSTPSHLQTLMKDQDFESGGLASRFLFANTIQKKNSLTTELFGDIQKVNRIEIKRLCAQIQDSQSFFDISPTAIPIGTIFTPETSDYFGKMRTHYGLDQVEDGDDASNRVQQHALTIAIIYMRAEGRTTILSRDIDAGWWITARSTTIYRHHRMLANQSITEDRQDTNKLATRSLIIDGLSKLKEGESCTARELRKKYKRSLEKITPEKMMVEITSLLASGDIKEEEKEIGGKRVKFYSLN